MSASGGRWQFWIDRGGTFTDCIAVDPQAVVHTAKILSSDDAPVHGIRRILEAAGALPAEAPVPACSVRLGSTVATNALLERRGVPTLLVTSAGLADVTTIGTQQRPALFEFAIERPPPLHARSVDLGGRVGPDGERLVALDPPAIRAAFRAARAAGLRSVAIALAHAYAFPDDERRLAAWAIEAGFEFVSVSHEAADELGLLARSETAAADAYLTPLLRAHIDATARALPGSRLRFMQSSGGLTEAERFRGPNALLSGPAGGVVGARRVARAAGFARAIGFDMGGTSTDVSLIPATGAGAQAAAPELDRVFESEVGGIRVRAPMLRIHTVAAGGGSLCRFDGFRLTVGPESAGSRPGPLCYGLRGEDGSPLAAELALTDANLFLGRVQPDRFPLALDPAPVGAGLDALSHQLREAGFERERDDVAAGCVAIANASMAQAIAQVSVARGIDPRECALVGFGGAAGQHVCAIARELGMRTVLLHPRAGLLSAWGIGLAEVAWDGQRDAGRTELEHAPTPLPAHLLAAFTELERVGRESLAAEGYEGAEVRAEHSLDLRYVGTDSALNVESSAGAKNAARAGAWIEDFEQIHEQRFGYRRPGRAVEVTTVRVRVRTGERDEPAPPASATAANGTPAAPLRRALVWFPGVGRRDAPIFERERLHPGARIAGPALVLEDSGTVVVDPGFRGEVLRDGTLVLRDEGAALGLEPASAADAPAIEDPVELEVAANRFASIAEQMGAVLRNTAVSTNIKERLDYSCAVFDADGGLVANAPHIPVHLGAMGETVRAVRERFPRLQPGDAVCTNDPFAGGSHLPDVTVVTPVFAGAPSAHAANSDAAEVRAGGVRRAPDFFVASRGHHADIGGITPGSMPPDSSTLEDEGVLLEPFLLVRGGQLDEAAARERLEGARYPARRPADNLADFEAQLAANRAGVDELRRYVGEHGAERVDATMRALQRASAAKVALEIAKLRDGAHRFRDALDDGTPIAVTLEVSGDRMVIDFAGTGSAVPGNLNAPRAVVHAAVIYVLRSLVHERIPLNGGCLDPVEIRIPEGSLLDPPRGAAVVGGNVETSQRVVDVLLGALGEVAASQGTMNNVTFGDAHFGYYETIGGGAGAGPGFDGASGVHTHMTNTRITDPEVLETRYPVILERFALRRGSGGAGAHRGGDGLVRQYRFRAPVTATLLTERRERAPYGCAGGEAGTPGRNTALRADGSEEPLAGRCSVELATGEGLRVETPGGGGHGPPPGGLRRR